jgi:hypothetical protein
MHRSGPHSLSGSIRFTSREGNRNPRTSDIEAGRPGEGVPTHGRTTAVRENVQGNALPGDRQYVGKFSTGCATGNERGITPTTGVETRNPPDRIFLRQDPLLGFADLTKDGKTRVTLFTEGRVHAHHAKICRVSGDEGGPGGSVNLS